MIGSKIKATFIFIGSVILIYIINKTLDAYYPKLMSNPNWFYNMGLKIATFKISLLALLISVILIFIIYKIIYAIILVRKSFRIIKATYGTDNKRIDITRKLNDCIVDNKLEIQLTNSVAGADPVRDVKKYANIKYKNGDKTIEIKKEEYEIIRIP